MASWSLKQMLKLDMWFRCQQWMVSRVIGGRSDGILKICIAPLGITSSLFQVITDACKTPSNFMEACLYRWSIESFPRMRERQRRRRKHRRLSTRSYEDVKFLEPPRKRETTSHNDTKTVRCRNHCFQERTKEPSPRSPPDCRLQQQQ